MTDLTDLEREVLDFAGQTWRYDGTKEAVIRERFDMSATRYYQLLNSLLDRQEALAYAPTTVHRLRRLRDQRREVRQ